MDTRVDLKAYPMPPTAKRLMPFQDMPFNGDGYAAAEVLRLKEKHGLTLAVETGTCYGSTSLFLHEHFSHTVSVEVHRPTFDVAVERCTKHVGEFMRQDVGTNDVWIGAVGRTVKNSLKLVYGDSPSVLSKHMAAWDSKHDKGDRFLFFLDAHWNDVCPLHEELKAIARIYIRPVIMIHDFLVHDHPELGFDRYPNGTPFTLASVAPLMDRIYGEGGWSHHTNVNAEGAKRGIGYFEPLPG